ncbi:uncharacterized protein At4g26485-like [Tasmannia lanceolata]|uniref:uncharacterized protein At4g26485-like n=1 Tax=Tasmannia lanceolata TaxID=3420 RepID=UPI004062A8AD
MAPSSFFFHSTFFMKIKAPFFMKKRKRTRNRAFSSIKREAARRKDSSKKEKNEVLEVWVTHYSSLQKFLLVGEGDFSFALSLAKGFGSGLNITATSLDPEGRVMKKYKKGKTNLQQLKKLGATIFHRIDATSMSNHKDLSNEKFDRIIYNFPHAGFRGPEHSMRVIRKHQKLISGFFDESSKLLLPNGEVHITNKTTGSYAKWDIEKLALKSSLKVIECIQFDKNAYEGYDNKRGDGWMRNNSFPVSECSTYKFKKMLDLYNSDDDNSSE